MDGQAHDLPMVWGQTTATKTHNQIATHAQRHTATNAQRHRVAGTNSTSTYKQQYQCGTSNMVSGQLPPGQLPPRQLPPDKYPWTITPLGQIPPDIYPPLRNFSSTYLGILCTYILHILFFLEEPNIHFMFHKPFCVL